MTHSSRGGAAVGGRASGLAGHVFVSASACLLTVTIFGSAVFLVHRLYERFESNRKIRAFLSALENRTAVELADRVAELRARPKVAERVLPELAQMLRKAGSEQQRCAAIEISRAFLDHRRIVSALFELRRDPRETVSSQAVSALAQVDPPEQAAELLGRCLDDLAAGELSPAALDQACAGLYRLGPVGLRHLQPRLTSLTPERRRWLVRYARSVGGPHLDDCLKMLGADKDGAVRSASQEAGGAGPAPGGATQGGSV